MLAVLTIGTFLLAPHAARGQAEPAPGPSGPGTPAAHGSVPARPGLRPRDPPPPRVRVAANVRFAGLLGETQEVAAPLGWGFGLQLSASLLPLGPLRLGFVLDFAQERFVRPIPAYSGQEQSLVHSTFAGQALLDLPTRFVRPHLGFGAGLSAARHDSPLPGPETQNMTTQDVGTAALLRLSAGLGISPLHWFEIGVSGELSLTFSDQRGGVLLAPTGELAERAGGLLFAPGWGSLAAWVGYRFY